MDFTGLLAGLDASVEGHLCDDATFFATDPGAAAEALPVRVMIDHPRPADRLAGMSFTRSRPVMRVRRSRVPDLREGQFFRHGANVWAVAEAPTIGDDGEWWVFEVEPG